MGGTDINLKILYMDLVTIKSLENVSAKRDD
jgi:hypothetical protein